MLHENDKNQYWQSVVRALDVLDSTWKADAASVLRKRVEELPSEAQELFYHAEPLDIARDLAGLPECSQAQVSTYLEKVQRGAGMLR